MKTSKKPFPPPMTQETRKKDDEPRPTGPNFPVMVLRIRAAGIDHLFFGPIMDAQGDLQEIEVMGLTSRDSLIEALKRGSEAMGERIVVQ